MLLVKIDSLIFSRLWFGRLSGGKSVFEGKLLENAVSE